MDIGCRGSKSRPRSSRCVIRNANCFPDFPGPPNSEGSQRETLVGVQARTHLPSRPRAEHQGTSGGWEFIAGEAFPS